MPTSIPKRLNHLNWDINPDQWYTIRKYVLDALNHHNATFIRLDMGFTLDTITNLNSLGIEIDYETFSELISKWHHGFYMVDKLSKGHLLTVTKLEYGVDRGWHAHCFLIFKRRYVGNAVSKARAWAGYWDHVIRTQLFSGFLSGTLGWFNIQAIHNSDRTQLWYQTQAPVLNGKQWTEPHFGTAIETALAYLCKPSGDPHWQPHRKYLRSIIGDWMADSDSIHEHRAILTMRKGRRHSQPKDDSLPELSDWLDRLEILDTSVPAPKRYWSYLYFSSDTPEPWETPKDIIAGGLWTLPANIADRVGHSRVCWMVHESAVNHAQEYFEGYDAQAHAWFAAHGLSHVSPYRQWEPYVVEWL